MLCESSACVCPWHCRDLFAAARSIGARGDRGGDGARREAVAEKGRSLEDDREGVQKAALAALDILSGAARGGM
jgi:hypothetical protein